MKLELNQLIIKHVTYVCVCVCVHTDGRISANMCRHVGIH